MAWFKALHLIFMVAWFAGLFYLPRLFVYHSLCSDAPGNERFKTMERKLYFGIMTPAGILTLVFGFLTLAASDWAQLQDGLWMHIKLLLAGLLVLYHGWCGVLLSGFRKDQNRHGHAWYRWFNEIPTILLVAIIILATVRPV